MSREALVALAAMALALATVGVLHLTAEWGGSAAVLLRTGLGMTVCGIAGLAIRRWAVS